MTGFTDPDSPEYTPPPPAELFRFEVPTSQGVFVIIGPDSLPDDEAKRIGEKIGRLVTLLVTEAPE